jgi:DNA polymerase-3 subunit alpha/error-prone DNA polymerase
MSMHCGGLVITPDPTRHYTPVEKSVDGYPLLAWEKEGTEAAGFVKIDLLGNRSLAVIRDTLGNLAEQGIMIDRDTWRPSADQATVAALAHGDSMGVFYIESPAMRQLQKKTGTGDFEHIVIHSSIIRPAANSFINEYVRRLKGGAWKPLHPRLAYILDETYGILCYQEDVSKTAVALAGFDEVEADRLRKVIAKKAGGVKLAQYEQQFFEGCKRNGVDAETTKQIWDMMLSFDGYSFCKPHSASYAMVSFQSAYLRVHHPAEFMAAVLSNQGGYYRPHAYIAECRRMGHLTEGPDINVSRWKYYGAGRRVIIGFMAVKGLSKSGAETIITERERNGEFRSLEDFSRRVRLGRDDITALCPAGVFDSISGGLARTMQARELLKSNTGARAKGQDDLFVAEGHSRSVGAGVLTGTRKTTSPDELWGEYRALGFLRKTHPLTLWKDKLAAFKRIKAIWLPRYVGNNVKLIGWPITQKEVWTKDGLTMSFLSFEDETGMYETVIFPQVYDKYHTLLFDQRPLVVYGKAVDDHGALTVVVGKIEVLGEKTAGPRIT